MSDPYAEGLGLVETAKPAHQADLDALWGYPPGYLNAAQWVLLGEGTPQEMLEAMKVLESQMTLGADGVFPVPPEPVSATTVWPADLAPERPTVRRSIRRGQSGRIRVVAGGRRHA